MSVTRFFSMLPGALFAVCLGLSAAVPTAAQEVDTEAAPVIEDLGNQRYRIGNILIDKGRGEFSVPGKVIRHQEPIEFLVTIRNGRKSYESVMEIDADAYQFNLACILIGLDAERATPFRERSSPEPLRGDRVDVTFGWGAGEQRVTARAAELLMVGEPPAPVDVEEWVYTGSTMIYETDFLAQVAGTIMGFVRRGESIIEHRIGVGLGNYGGVFINTDLLPEIGGKIEMTVRRSETPFSDSEE